MALCTAFAEELDRSGVRLAVISPGSRSTPLALAFFRQDGIETEIGLDERSASFYALGAAQAFIMFAVSLAIYLAVIGVGRATGLVPKRRKAKKAEV